jgi:hypothetical protein
MALVNPQDCFDQNGHLRPVRELSEAVARALAGFEVDDAGALRKIRLEKTRALETLARHHNLIQPDQSNGVQLTINVDDSQIKRLERFFEQAALQPIPGSPAQPPTPGQCLLQLGWALDGLVA